jgi:hypothetical protein
MLLSLLDRLLRETSLECLILSHLTSSHKTYSLFMTNFAKIKKKELEKLVQKLWLTLQMQAQLTENLKS